MPPWAWPEHTRSAPSRLYWRANRLFRWASRIQKGSAAGGVDLGGQFLRRLLVGVAVGIVDARQDNGVPVPLQGHELVGQHRDAVGGEDFLQRRHSAHGPLVVAGDVVGGGNGRKSPGGLRRVAVRRPPVLVLQIPRKKMYSGCSAATAASRSALCAPNEAPWRSLRTTIRQPSKPAGRSEKTGSNRVTCRAVLSQ